MVNTNDSIEKNMEEKCLISDPPEAFGSSKKKKKPKKKKTLADLAPFYSDTMQRFPVQLKNTKANGRHAVAAEALDAGTTVCLEKATAFVVRSPYLDQQCHVCLGDLPAKMACQDCRMVFYCSQACIEKDEATHLKVCSLLAHAQSIGQSTDVDPDLLRLIIMLVASRDDNDISKTPYWCVDDLMSHREKAEPSFVRVISTAANRLIAQDPDLMHDLTVEDIVSLACRINSNAHGLGDNQSRNTDVALGLFPLGAMFFNHGCNPNTAFVGLDNGQLAFRTIRPVAKDEELVVSYIDLYDGRDDRRQILLTSKHFWCKCKRCQSNMQGSVDRFLQGVVCKACQQDVYVVPPTLMDDLLKDRSNLTTALNEPNTTQWACAKCQATEPSAHIARTLQECQQQYTQAITLVHERRQYTKAKQLLKPLVFDTRQLHALHSLRLNAAIPLMNCCRYEKDLKGAVEVNQFILNFFEQQAVQGGLPSQTSEVSDFWLNLGELYEALAAQHRDRALLEKKYHKVAQHAYTQASKVRSIVFGPSHPKTKAIQALRS
ncbi:SET domain-containing protein [Hesseltinella vesiculosa]|uniref:SET domain-containing protein n=1 Tax=Hesseltinella vesiculosa TaxID=101127 RepID=A0A1X2GNN7_9FUNG|nr:SET domain-containing protein [Hesseltinella vesiculosa]